MAEKQRCMRLNIKHLHKGEIATCIAPIYGIEWTTVNNIKTDADKIEKHASKMESTNINIKVRKNMKPTKLDQLNTAMYQWFIQAHS